ncbi:MAG: hypothetical protein M1833_004187 [Piccolia ochrophora]|nr:MAG: hypothetical protein M1833_004187 [Piccolia ochrophora]
MARLWRPSCPGALSNELALNQSIQSLPPPSTSLAGAEPRAVVSAEATDFAALSEPFFIVPSGFRHNSVFVGMTKELNELDQKLFDVKARASGSARVLVHCLPGGGKSRVAWEYVSTRKDKWPGGIFWIGAKSKSEIAQGFWDIAQKVALEDVEDPRNAQFEKDTEVFINAVKAWFQNRQDWLLVFDGVTIDQEADKAGLQAFIPDNQNSGVIITSVDKSLAGSSEPLSPVAVKVASLSEDEARRLLFLELGVSNPSFAEREKALEIVKKVECLPLAVHTIGHRLRNYGEPLLKYHIKSYPSDSRLKAPFVEIMEDLRRLRHDEARNLINILCFFGQHIPVEMINLGLKALSSPPNRDPAGRPREVQVKAREGGGPRDLNVTFGTLMKYALIERNDPDDAASQSSHPSLTKTIDMLRIHSVVQGFLCDSLKSAGQLPKWLGHAVDMFCWSFREADGRIKGKEGSGLVKDYREYEVHGNRLNEHIKKYQIRFPKLEIVRFELEKALKVVEEEIQKLTPNSSQETLPRKTCQVSVFDRTSSASDAGPETPTRRLSTVSTWGLDIGKAHLDSPVSIGPESPGPTILDYNPHAQLLPFYDEDVGYDSGREQHFAPQDMVASHSQRTARPASTERRLDEQKAVGRDLTLQASFEEDPQMHRTVSARQQRRYRDSVSSWRRIEPKSTDPRVSKITAQRFEARKTKASPTGSHDSGSQAEIALGAFKHAGTAIDPPLIETHSGKGRQSSSSSISPSQLLARLGSYAEVLRGRTGKTPTTVEEPVPSPDLEENYAPSVSFIPRAQSDGSSPNRENNERPPPSPLASGPSALQPASQSLPPQNSGMAARHTRDSQSLSPHSSPGLKYAQPMRTSDPDLRHLLQQGSIEEHLSMPQSGQAFRRNPAPLPFEDISAGSKRLLPQDFRGHGHQGMVYYVPASSSSLHNMPPSSAYTHSSYPYGPDDSYISRPQPTGYTSQPMSRHPSGQSAIGMQSVTGTEPARFPPQFSPPLGSGPLSPRARHRDGAPMRKSPKLQAVHAFPKSPSVIDATPRYAGDEAFTAIGDWAGVHGSTSMNMSRSSSGPGIAANGGIIKFGDQPPLDLANENWGEDEEFLPVRREDFQQAFARGLFRMDRGRPRRPLWESVASAPYPDTSQMPRTGSDLQAMMREEQRRRGLSAPMPPAPHVGYGVDLSRSVPGQESTHSG